MINSSSITSLRPYSTAKKFQKELMFIFHHFTPFEKTKIFKKKFRVGTIILRSKYF